MSQETQRSTIKPHLVGKQLSWVLAYLKDPARNATAAAREVGYKNAKLSGFKNFHNPKIQQWIQAHYEEQHASAEEATAVLAAQMRGSLGEFIEFAVDDDGRPTGDPIFNLAKLDEADRMEILKKVTIIETYTSSNDRETTTKRYHVEIHDPQAAAEKILKAFGKINDGATAAVIPVFLPAKTPINKDEKEKNDDK